MKLRNVGISAVVIAAALLGAAPAAFAATSGTQAISATVNAGTLSITPPGAFSYSETLNGSDTYADFPLSVGADDNTGSGNGWNITVVSTPLEFTASGATSPTIVSSAWQLYVACAGGGATPPCGPTPTANGSGTYTLPTGNSVNYPTDIPGIYGGSTTPTPAVVYEAQAGSGLGDFTLSQWDEVLFIPANAIAGPYTATVTWTIASGP
jgi:hypothetical protein